MHTFVREGMDLVRNSIASPMEAAWNGWVWIGCMIG